MTFVQARADCRKDASHGGCCSRTLRDIVSHTAACFVVFLVCLSGRAQAGSNQDGTAANTAFTVNGVVIDGLNESPIPRALVHLNNRAVLTDGLGRFTLPSFVGTEGSAQVTKPGYSDSPDDPGSRPTFQLLDLTSRLELKLYPNALITGTVTGSDRLPLEHTQVILMRADVDDSGPVLQPAAFTQTDAHGQYRFNQPPGRYRISVPFSQRANIDGSVLLPTGYPETSSSEILATFTVSSKEERRIDLHPRTAPAFPVRFHLDGQNPGRDVAYNPRITIRTGSGSSFAVFARTRGEGEYEMQLPSGTYQMHAVVADGEGRREAEGSVTINGHAVDGLVLHFDSTPSIPVEMSVESIAGAENSATGTGQPPRLNNLGLRLQSVPQADPGSSEEFGLNLLDGNRATLQVSPGVYRLRARFLSQWYVRSATYGGVDLLVRSFTVAPGAGGEPLRLLLANDSGQVTLKVTGIPSRSAVFLYFLAHQPTLFPALQGQTDLDGNYSRSLPPGNYTVYAFPRRFPGDLSDPETMHHLAAGTELNVAPSGKTTLTVAIQPVEASR